ncbi:hypothetical protein AHiyo8_pI67120 (plasmid) [Arthrobacter sp. Hiyo8]|nr:hypothetical protein AHiyo8_pI67120 [Arthrobacter sp. Hiyo8]GAP61474.1 hypothetical protein AHiyo1_51790 [Arthrobacter sp. Hiyo1]
MARDFDFDGNPNINPAAVHTLAAGDWIRKGLPLCLLGAGTGKSPLFIGLDTAAGHTSICVGIFAAGQRAWVSRWGTGLRAAPKGNCGERVRPWWWKSDPCDSCGVKRGKWVAGGALGAVIVVALVVVGVRVWDVHQMTSDWALWPKEVPSKVQFANRDYKCGANPMPNTHSLDGLTKRGKTAGGADIYSASPGTQSGTATWIVIMTGQATYTCDLMGGP